MIPSLSLTLCSTLLWDSSSLSANCLSTALIPESLITSKSSSCIRITALINHFTLNLIHGLVFPFFIIITISSSDALRIGKIINQAILPSVDGICNSQHQQIMKCIVMCGRSWLSHLRVKHSTLLTPTISLVILLTVCYTIHVTFIWRIWNWINQ